MDASGSHNQSGQTSASEVAELRRELANVHRALMLQSDALARQRQRAGDLELKLASQNAAANKRLQARDQQLATLVRALLVLEAKLKREQKKITIQFETKNAQIYQQREQIKKLKQESSMNGAAYCRNCQHLIGSTSEQTNIETDPEFHSLESVETHYPNKFERSFSYQEKPQLFQKNLRLSKSFQLPKTENNHDNTSSSEEVFENGDGTQGKSTYVKNKQAFVRKDVTRRSRKYSGRKHSSAYLESVQKKISNKTQVSSSSAEDGAQSEKDSKVYDENGYDIGEEISKDIERASNRIDELLLNASQNSNSNQQLFNDSVQLRLKQTIHDTSLSTKIETLHGIKNKQKLFENKNKEKPWYTNTSDLEQDMDSHYVMKREKINRYRCKSADDILVATFNNTDLNDEVKSNKILSEYLPSPSTIQIYGSNDNQVNSPKMATIDSIYNKLPDSIENNKFSTNDNKFDNEPSENWYASASDQDEDQSCGIYKNNPVLECVNQILLQNNLDESTNDMPRAVETNSPKTSMKRVQFSTLNSISFEEHVKRSDENKVSKEIKPSERRPGNKIVKFSLDTASEHSYEIPISSEGFNYEVQSIYSNDYEPILTKSSNVTNNSIPKSKVKPVPMPRMINGVNKHNDIPKKQSMVKNIASNLENKTNSNHYVDMDTKFGQEIGFNKRNRVPPALPPKPKNLVSKFKLNNQNNGVHINSILNSDSVEINQRITDVQNMKGKQENSSSSTKSNIGSEPDYCSISEINVPVVNSVKKDLITTVEVHAEQFSPNITERRPVVSKMATISKINPNKISDKDIPKLPQVTEIIIPDEDDTNDNSSHQRSTHDNYQSINNAKLDTRNSIQMGHSVSSILTDIKNRNPNFDDVNKCILSTEHNRQFPGLMYYKSNLLSDRPHLKLSEKSKTEPILQTIDNDCEKFDLSQNFEEFKIDECEFTSMAEEYKISSSDTGSSDSANDDTKLKINMDSNDNIKNPPSFSDFKINETIENSTKNALKHYSKMSNKPDLLSNIDNLETDSVKYSDLESSNSSSSNCGSYNTVKCEPSTFVEETTNVVNLNPNQSVIPFEYFLESSGMSSKSILTPSRPPNSNHKNVLKPKDIKMRSKNITTIGRATPLYEKCSNTAIKYFEPYI